MKVAIFGDSFAHTEDYNESKAWYTHTKNTTNFSRAGSSLWYSFNLFCKHHREFDKIIFFVTNWGRIHLSQLGQPFWPGIQQIEGALKSNNINDDERKTLTSVYNWIIFGRNEEQEISLHELMIDSVKRMHKDVLIIPCFNFDQSRVESKYSMFDIHHIDIQHYNIDWQDSKKIWHRRPLRPNGRELRACHMNDENNIIFANKINKWIDTGTFNLDVNNFVISKKTVDSYFELAD